MLSNEGILGSFSAPSGWEGGTVGRAFQKVLSALASSWCWQAGRCKLSSGAKTWWLNTSQSPVANGDQWTEMPCLGNRAVLSQGCLWSCSFGLGPVSIPGLKASGWFINIISAPVYWNGRQRQEYSLEPCTSAAIGTHKQETLPVSDSVEDEDQCPRLPFGLHMTAMDHT